MVNDVDYTRISALALHDWSACAPVGPDRLPRLLVSEAVPADDTWGTRFFMHDTFAIGDPQRKTGGRRASAESAAPSAALRPASVSLGTPASVGQCPSGP